MIEEVYDDSEDDIISDNSPEKAGQIAKEYNIITDFSSPLKNDQDTIIDVSSPETDVSKISALQGSSREISHFRRCLFRIKKEPSFALNTSKQNPTIILNEENIVDVSSHSSLVEENSPDMEVVNDDDSIDVSSNNSMAESTTINENKSSKDLGHMLKNQSETEGDKSNVIKAPKRPLFGIKRELRFTQNTPKKKPTKILKKENIVDVSSHSSLVEENSPDVEVVIDDDSIDLSSNNSMAESTTINENKSSKDLGHMLKNQSETEGDKSNVIKAPKRGSLLEKALQISSMMKKESLLYSHELRVGLRTSQGYFVSDILYIKAIAYKKTYRLLECAPHNNFSAEYEYLSSLSIMISSSVQRVLLGWRIVVHFPVICMLDLFSRTCFVLANERVQLISKSTSSKTLTYSSKIKINKSPTKKMKIFHTLKSRASKNILDAVIGYLLINEHTLQLEILHIYIGQSNNRVYLKLLTCDSEKQFCIVQLPYSDEIFNALQIGSIYTFTGFIMTDCLDVTCKIRNAAEYYSSVIMKNDYIFLMEPQMNDDIDDSNDNWKIKFLQKSVSERTSVFTTLDKIIHQKFDEEKRFKLSVSAVTYIKSEVYIKDQSMDKYFYLNVCLQNQEIFFPYHPFFLEGVYLHKGDLYFDEFSRIENNVD